jgi:hypothetical protein
MKNVYAEKVYLNGIKGLKKAESRYEMMNGKAILQLPEQKNRRNLIPEFNCHTVYIFCIILQMCVSFTYGDCMLFTGM